MLVLKIAVVIGCIIAGFKSMDNILDARNGREIAFNTLVLYVSIFALIYIVNNWEGVRAWSYTWQLLMTN